MTYFRSSLRSAAPLQRAFLTRPKPLAERADVLPGSMLTAVSSVPLNCSFCQAGGPESLVEVKTKILLKYSRESVVAEGRFWCLMTMCTAFITACWMQAA